MTARTTPAEQDHDPVFFLAATHRGCDEGDEHRAHRRLSHPPRRPGRHLQRPGGNTGLVYRGRLITRPSMDTKPPGSQQPTTTPARRSRERGARTASQHSSSLTPTEHMPRPPSAAAEYSLPIRAASHIVGPPARAGGYLRGRTRTYVALRDCFLSASRGLTEFTAADHQAHGKVLLSCALDPVCGIASILRADCCINLQPGGCISRWPGARRAAGGAKVLK